MSFNLKSFQKNLSALLISKAKKCTIRECDEIGKGVYVAFVDENDKTFDVKIEFGSKDEIANLECDCGLKTPICQHKVALIEFVTQNKTVKHKIVGKKKQTDLDKILDEISFQELQEWIKLILPKNKELELSFINFFTNKNKIYTPEDVKKVTLEAVKAICKSKSKIDQSELKRILELWNDVHKPIIENFCANVTIPENFLNFHELIEVVMDYHFNIRLNTTKVKSYANNVLKRVIDPIARLESDSDWISTINFFVNKIISKEKQAYLRQHYINFLIDSVEHSDAKRKNKMADLLAKNYIDLTKNFNSGIEKYTEDLFGFIINTEKIGEYIHIFQPIRYNNDFNASLISLLLEHNHIAEAEKHCLDQIKGNYQDEYNVAYWRILKTIYNIKKDAKKELGISEKLLPFDFNFDDFKNVYNKFATDIDRKDFRTKFLAKARNKARNDYNIKAAEFIMDLFFWEENGKKMVETICDNVPYHLLLNYFDFMFLSDKIGLLKQLLNLEDIDRWGMKAIMEKNKIELPKLFEKTIEKYGEETLKLSLNAIKQDRFFYRNRTFVDYARAQFHPKAK